MESTTVDYHLLLKQVITLSTVGDFAKHWTFLKHGSPSELFFDSNEKKHIKLEVGEDTWKIIETLCLFKSGIHPSFEDEHNGNGGGIYYVLDGLEKQQIDTLWLNLSAALVGTDLAIANNLNGIRFADKCTDHRTSFRIEFWLDSDISKTPEYETFKNQVTSIFYDSSVNTMSQPIYKIHRVDKKPVEKKNEEKKEEEKKST